MAVLEAAMLNVKNIKQHVINCFLLRLPSCLPQTRTTAALHLWITRPLTMICCPMKSEVVCASPCVCVYLHAHMSMKLWLITCWLDTDQGYFSRLYFNIFNRYLKQNIWIVKWSMLLGFFFLPMKTANIYVNIFNQHFSCLYLYRFKSFNNSSALPHNNMDIKDCFHLSVVTYADICEHILLINYHLRVFSRLRLKCCLNCPLCLYCSLGFFFWVVLVGFLF